MLAKAKVAPCSALFLGVVLLLAGAVSQTRAQADDIVVFQDDLTGEELPGGSPMEGLSPTIGDPYTGQGLRFHKGNSAEEENEVLKAFSDRPFVKPQNAQFESLCWNLEKGAYAETLGKVTVSFDFYMRNRGGVGKGMIGVISFADAGTGGRGWDIALKEDGTVTWWDGREFHATDIQFETDAVVSFRLTADFSNRTYTATIGNESFTGALAEEAKGVRRVMFYNSTGVEFFYTNPKITVAP